MKPIYKLINPAQGIPMKASGSPAVGSPMTGEPDTSNPTEVPDNLQNITSTDSSLEASIKSDAPKKSSNEVSLKIDFSDNSLVQGFIMSEILARPKAMKRRGNTIWSSRF